MRANLGRTLLFGVLLFAAAGCDDSKTYDDDDGDTVPPQVSSQSPASGAIGVPLDAPVSVTFNEPILASSVTSSTFTLSTGGTAVGAAVTTSGSTLRLVPALALSPSKTYSASAAASISDLAGNALTAPVGWSFITASSASFALTSTGLVEGGDFIDRYNCDGGDGMDYSPPLAWTGVPPGTLSWAIIFTDLDNGFLHWVIFDIPLATASLPEFVANTANPVNAPAGTKQTECFDGATFGYRGPCPGAATHTYQFRIYAIDVATIPGITTASTAAQAKAAIEMHDLASVTLTGTSD